MSGDDGTMKIYEPGYRKRPGLLGWGGRRLAEMASLKRWCWSRRTGTSRANKCLGKEHPGRGTRKCKGHEIEKWLVFSRESKEAK